MLMFTRSSPASFSGPASFGKRRPLVVIAICSIPGTSLDRTHQLDQVGAQAGLAAGQTDLAEAGLGRSAHDQQQLLAGQQLGAWHKVHPDRRHTVDTAQIAAIGERDPHIVDLPAKRVVRRYVAGVGWDGRPRSAE